MARKGLNGRMVSFLSLLIAIVFSAFSARSAERLPKEIRWTATAILLDSIDTREKYSIPIKEAIRFVDANSRFRIQFFAEVSAEPHTYTFYDCDAGAQSCVLVNKWDLDPVIWESIRTTDFYMILWEADGHPPLLAGGTWGVADGVLKGGLNRPYITIPVDPWWYHNEPSGGFNSSAAHIMAHEIINAINSKLEVAPYNCMPLTADAGVTNEYEYEASRLAKLTDDCYRRYLDINSHRRDG